MLHSYSISNFQSFKETAFVDFTLSQQVSLTDWMVKTAAGNRLSKLMAVIGANGSGKTTLLKGLAFLSWFIKDSVLQNHPDATIPVIPYATMSEKPSEFECVFELHNKIWRYQLRCTPKQVLHEALYQKLERFNYVFVRDWDETSKKYHIKQQDFSLTTEQASKVRQNASFIAWAVQNDDPLALSISKLNFVSNINIFGREPMGWAAVEHAAEHFSINLVQREKMAHLLSAWDLGLSDIELAEIKEYLPIATELPERSNKKKWLPIGKHKGHDAEFRLPFYFQSSGTQSAFVLLSRLLAVLETGGIAIIDELENDIHPHMLEPILGLFADSSTNPKQAQLLFTCHSIEILNLIHKSQVMLVEKDAHCESTAIRLDKIKGIRNDDNLYAKYMAGAYGAVPKF